MYITKILLISCILFCAYADNTIQQAFEDAGLIPSIILTAPENLLVVKYANATVNLGNELTPEEASAQPSVKFNGTSDKLYSFFVIDPDTMRDNAYICHCMILNVNGSTANITAGDEVIKYEGPAPPAGQGYHKYVFLVYSQANKINATSIVQQMGFNVMNFAQNYTLSGPLFGNFFKAQNASNNAANFHFSSLSQLFSMILVFLSIYVIS